MPSPFPGMGPYLEQLAIFPDLHGAFETCLREAVIERLPESYFAKSASRVRFVTTHCRIEPDVNVLRPETGVRRKRPATEIADVNDEPVEIHCASDEMRGNYLEIIPTAPDGKRLVTVVERFSIVVTTVASMSDK